MPRPFLASRARTEPVPESARAASLERVRALSLLGNVLSPPGSLGWSPYLSPLKGHQRVPMPFCSPAGPLTGPSARDAELSGKPLTAQLNRPPPLRPLPVLFPGAHLTTISTTKVLTASVCRVPPKALATERMHQQARQLRSELLFILFAISWYSYKMAFSSVFFDFYLTALYCCVCV